MNRREAMLAIGGMAVAVPTLPMIPTPGQPWKPMPSRVEYSLVTVPRFMNDERQKEARAELDRLSHDGFEMVAVVPDGSVTEYIFARRVPLEAGA